MRRSWDEALRQAQELDAAYARADQHEALLREWVNMVFGSHSNEAIDEFIEDDLRRAALNRRGQP